MKRKKEGETWLSLSLSLSLQSLRLALSGGGIAARDRRQNRFQNRFFVRGLAGLGFGSRRRAVIVKRQAGDDAANLNRIERFAREQFLGQTVQGVAVLDDDLASAFVLLHHDAFDFLIDLDRGVFAVILMLSDLASQEDLLFLLAESQRAEIRHTELANHLARQVGCALDVVRGAGRDLAEEDVFGKAATHQNRDRTFDVIAAVSVAVAFWQLLGQAQSHSARNDRDLVNRIGVGNFQPDDGVTGFVIGRRLLLLFGHYGRSAFRSHQHLVFSPLEIVHRDDFLVVAGGVERGLVHQVGQIGAGETGRAAGDDRNIDVFAERNLASVYGQNAFAPFHVGAIDDHAPVEASRTKQRRIEHVRAVGRSDQDHAVVRFETVHLDQQLVERLFALVVPAPEPRSAVASDGVDLVDENDAGRVLLALLEKVAHAAGADAHEHFDEIRA